MQDICLFSTEQFVLAGRVTLRRTIRIPLKTSEGQWLAAGRYTLRAETGLGEALAQVPIDIVGTGIRGQVFFREFTLGAAPPPDGDGLIVSDPIPIQATVRISEMRDPNAQYDHPPFAWSGLTDSQGHFNVATPAGRFFLIAHSNRVVGVCRTETPDRERGGWTVQHAKFYNRWYARDGAYLFRHVGHGGATR
ncbi:MAG TPA: hypothetical protein VFD27_02900 [Chthoniobacteraceae bacterium]|nr:hypothetical protein [Chthoniobacteraceae bacterium]